MKSVLQGIYTSFPIQLFMLHLRKYQILLVFWFLLVIIINGDFLSSVGADALFLSPEYMGKVNPLSTLIVGIAMGIFIMSWHITTFILHSNEFRFLATTSNPFLKYCINNSIIPVFFLLMYCYRIIQFDLFRELISNTDIVGLLLSFVFGINIIIVVSFTYFFGAEKTLLRQLNPVVFPSDNHLIPFNIPPSHEHEKGIITVNWFYNTRFKLKKPRNIDHYSPEFIKSVFRKHHFSAVIAILLTFIFLSVIGLLQDIPAFMLPAGAGILLFFSILMSGAAAIAYWLKSWSFPIIMLLLLGADQLFRKHIIEIRSKAYGLDYSDKSNWPAYNQNSIVALCSKATMEKDKHQMIEVLDNWKKRQEEAKPVMVVMNFSGGGIRAASFSFNVLQQLDSISEGKLMQHTFLMCGASGGMLGATYFRELYRLQTNGTNINRYNRQYAANISGDLLNPLFSSLATRDIFSPAQKFQYGTQQYLKDRAYAFEQQFNENTNGILNHQLKDYIDEEHEAKIPLMFFSSTISADARKMIVSTQPISFMMRNHPDTLNGILGDPDAIDFSSFFKNQSPYNMRLLTTLRINATFPYVLPNVWLPSTPVVDIMDAGIRDNNGQETAIRFLHVFDEWIAENTSGVLFIQVRDRKTSDWNSQLDNEGLAGVFFKPLSVIQNNWMKIQDFYQEQQVSYSHKLFNFPFRKYIFSYTPSNGNKTAALSFHLTTREKFDIAAALRSTNNAAAFKAIKAGIQYSKYFHQEYIDSITTRSILRKTN
jgi:hypothetical protein